MWRRRMTSSLWTVTSPLIEVFSTTGAVGRRYWLAGQCMSTGEDGGWPRGGPAKARAAAAGGETFIGSSGAGLRSGRRRYSAVPALFR